MHYAIRFLSWITLPAICVVMLPIVIYRAIRSDDRFWIAFCDHYREIIEWCLEWDVDFW